MAKGFGDRSFLLYSHLAPFLFRLFLTQRYAEEGAEVHGVFLESLVPGVSLSTGENENLADTEFSGNPPMETSAWREVK